MQDVYFPKRLVEGSEGLVRTTQKALELSSLSAM
jgi:hypothetical protein